MKLFKKTALAVAMTAVSASGFAASDLRFTDATTDGTVVLADVIFGNGKPGTGSEETLITAPSVTFELDGTGDNGTAASKATIKFTLGGGAVFGEDLSTTAAVIASNGGASALTTFLAGGVATGNSDNSVASEVQFDVVQGGAIGDNTITFELEFAANDDVLESVTFEGYAVKNLTSALNPDSASKMVELGVEYVESADTTTDLIASTATDTPLVVFGSAAPVTLDATPFDFDDSSTNFLRINVGAAEKKFTAGTVDGRTDFTGDDDVTFVNLGTLQLERNAIDTTAAGFPGALAGLIKKENGDDFDFQGGDKHSLSFSVGTGRLQEGSTIYLVESATACTAAVPGSALGSNVIAASETGAFNIAVTGTTTELTSEYNVCYSANTAATAESIPEVGEISVTWNIDFFNARYDNVATQDGNYGDLLRNGCIASFFNVPASGNADTAYIRLTNTSSSNEGDIRGTLYAQDGTVLGRDKTIAPDLAIHATQIFSTEGADRTTGAGQEVIDIETAFGVDGADYKGRARLVLKGAFDTCEGQGLIRTGGGSLFNMTSTTQGNEAANPNDGNNGN